MLTSRTMKLTRLGRCASRILFCCAVFLALFFHSSARAAGTVTVATNVTGPTPVIVGYDSGHYLPLSNTGDWLRYAGVTGVRIFVSPSYIEPASQFPAIASTVTNSTSFLSLKAAVRANPWNTTYLNWSYVTNQYSTSGLIGSDYVNVAYALSNMQQMGMQAVIQATASSSEFETTNWPGFWQVWQLYYQQAFYLGYKYGVQRYQMYNEPDDGGPSGTNYLILLQLASDAIQSGIADVNTMYGTSLTPMVFAPVTAGAPTSTFSTYGKLVVTNRHINFLGQSNASFSLIQKYDYHQYGGTPQNPSVFTTDLTYVESQLSATMAPETPYPPTITEFNVFDGSTFESMASTLDTPTNYSGFAAIAVNLIANGINELYCFKLSETVGSGYPAKNGTHFVDNTNSPYNIGGLTKGGEVWRLFNKAVAPGRNLLGYSTTSPASSLNLLASYDPVALQYHVLSVNNTSAAIPFTLNLASWNIPTGNSVLVEAVNETCYGAGALFTNLAGSSLSLTQGSNSVFLVTVSALPQVSGASILASANAQVIDGANKLFNYSGRTNLLIENNSTNASYRSAAFLQFHTSALTNLQTAILTLTAANSPATIPTNECFLYGITSNNWSENTVTWSTAPNLAQGVSPGTLFVNNFVLGAGTTAYMLGELAPGPTSAQYTFDVTSFLKMSGTTNVSFMLAREVRYLGDDQDGYGISVVSREGSATLGPQLQLIFNEPITMQSPQMMNGIFSFTVTGPPGYLYNIQNSTNLTNWATVSTISNATGSFQYLTNNPQGPAQSYFRAVMIP